MCTPHTTEHKDAAQTQKRSGTAAHNHERERESTERERAEEVRANIFETDRVFSLLLYILILCVALFSYRHPKIMKAGKRLFSYIFRFCFIVVYGIYI